MVTQTQLDEFAPRPCSPAPALPFSCVDIANAHQFLGAYLEANHAYLIDTFGDDRDGFVQVLLEAQEAAIEAALYERAHWPSDVANPEAMQGKGRDWLPSIGG